MRIVASNAQVLGPALHGLGAHVATALALGQRDAAFAGRFARQFIQGRIEPLRLEIGADLDQLLRLWAVAGRLWRSFVEWIAASRGR